MFRWISKFLIGICLLAISTAQAAELMSPPEPIQIRAKSMTVRNNENVAIFENNVVVTRGDFTMLANRVEVLFGPVGESQDTGGSAAVGAMGRSDFRDVRSLHAVGGVVVTQEETRAESEEAHYDGPTEVVTLTGNPVVVEDASRVAGSKITIYLKENRSVVENSRVLVDPGTKGPSTRPENP